MTEATTPASSLTENGHIPSGEVRSVFAEQAGDLFALYEAELTFEGKLMGGIPQRRKVIEGWIKAGAKIEDPQEQRRMMLKTLIELGANVNANMTDEEIDAAAEKLAESHTNGFKQDENGLFIEDRQVKAMLKESTNIVFPYEKGKPDGQWGKTKKTPRSFLAETVFIRPARIYLGRTEPDGVELVVGHVSGPKGKQSTLTYHEYVECSVITVQLEMLRDELEHEQWARIWYHAERNGLGALRSQSHGRFACTRWERIK